MEMFEWLPNFAKAAVVGAVPLMFVVLGLVEWFKRFKRKDGSQAITGNTLILVSMVIGLLFGVGYMVTQERPPASLDVYVLFVYWFMALVFGLAIGLISSGVYDIYKNIKQSTTPQFPVSSPEDLQKYLSWYATVYAKKPIENADQKTPEMPF